MAIVIFRIQDRDSPLIVEAYKPDSYEYNVNTKSVYCLERVHEKRWCQYSENQLWRTNNWLVDGDSASSHVKTVYRSTAIASHVLCQTQPYEDP